MKRKKSKNVVRRIYKNFKRHKNDVLRRIFDEFYTDFSRILINFTQGICNKGVQKIGRLNFAGVLKDLQLNFCTKTTVIFVSPSNHIDAVF